MSEQESSIPSVATSGNTTQESAKEMTQIMSGLPSFDILASADIPGNKPTIKERLLEKESTDGLQTKPDAEKQEEGRQEEEVKKDEVTLPAKEEKPLPVKALKAKHNDKEIEVPEDSAFSFKVEGQDVSVPVKELIRNYQGKIPWDKYHQQSAVEKKRFEAEQAAFKESVGEVNATLGEIVSTFEKNPYLAFEKIARLANKNPADCLPVWIAQSKATVADLEKLSEAEYRAVLLAKRAEFDRQTLEDQKKIVERKEQRVKEQQERTEADNYFASKVKEFQISEEEINKAARDFEVEKVDLTGKTSKEVADIVVAYITQIDRPYTLVEQAIEKVDATLLKDRELVKNIKSHIDSSFSVSDVEAIVRGYLADQREEASPPAKAPPAKVPSKESLPAQQKASSAIPQKKSNQREADGDIGPVTFADLFR